jgi:hypothetical protein
VYDVKGGRPRATNHTSRVLKCLRPSFLSCQAALHLESERHFFLRSLTWSDFCTHSQVCGLAFKMARCCEVPNVITELLSPHARVTKTTHEHPTKPQGIPGRNMGVLCHVAGLRDTPLCPHKQGVLRQCSFTILH